MATRDKIQVLIKEICGILEMSVPRVVIAPQEMRTGTQLAALCDDILILRDNSLTADTAFAIAHELRHKWQLDNFREEYFEDYKEVGELSVEDYNRQAAEIDANAFAVVAMASLFGIEPRFDRLSDDLKQKIFERAKKISENLED